MTGNKKEHLDVSTDKKRNDDGCRKMLVTLHSDDYPRLAAELLKMPPGKRRVHRLLTLAEIGALATVAACNPPAPKRAENARAITEESEQGQTRLYLSAEELSELGEEWGGDAR